MTEWIQIVIVLVVVVPLTILTGRYLMWRKWDRERRIDRMAKREGWNAWFAERHADNPGFSVKVP